MDSRISARALSQALGGWRTRAPSYEALADGIRLLCLDNRLAPRTALPAERALAQVLDVSRTTVAASYASLRDSGHIVSVRGSGSVTVPLPRARMETVPSGEGTIDLQQACPPAWPGLASVIAEKATLATELVARSGYDYLGSLALREMIAARYLDRGIPTDPAEILVTTGAQSAIHLLATTLISRGDRVIIETPTYPHAADALSQAGARLVAVPVSTHAGWDLDRADQAFSRTLPVAAYLMPDFQNPTGCSMTENERRVFVNAAQSTGTVLIIDETTSELDIDRGPVPDGFLDMDTSLVVRVGSLGKTVWGGLRVGWVRGNADLIRRLVAARPMHDLGTPEFEQSVAETVLENFAPVLLQRGHFLRQSRDATASALAECIPQWGVPSARGGVSLWVDLDKPLSSGLVTHARSRGLLLSAGSRFGVGGGHDQRLRIPFTAQPDRLVTAVHILAESWAWVGESAPRFPTADVVV